MANYWTTFLDLLYPPKCPGCKKTVHEHGAWCPICLVSIMSVREVNMQEHNLRFLDSCQVVCEYTGGLKRVIHDMKFRQQERYAIYLHWLIKQSIHIECFAHIHYVIPVPLHAERLKERGYNQVESIFKNWAMEGSMLWMPTLLKRTRHTIPQWELTMMERKQNIRGAFATAQPQVIEKKNIVVVDDIITTGITLDECAKALKQSGAASVHGLAVASGVR